MELTEKGYGENDVYPLVYAIMHRVAFFVFPDHQILDLAGPFAAFETAARLSGRSLYRFDTLSRAGGLVAGRGGLPAYSDDAARVFQPLSAHRSNLMAPTIPI
jgi:transcriptional regulator GlxA family with amidase domain